METIDTAARKHPIAIGEFDPTAQFTLQRDQLLSKRGIFRLKPASRLDRRGQQPEDKEQRRDHRADGYAILSPDQYGRIFCTRSAGPCGCQGTSARLLHSTPFSPPYSDRQR